MSPPGNSRYYLATPGSWVWVLGPFVFFFVTTTMMTRYNKSHQIHHDLTMLFPLLIVSILSSSCVAFVVPVKTSTTFPPKLVRHHGKGDHILQTRQYPNFYYHSCHRNLRHLSTTMYASSNNDKNNKEDGMQTSSNTKIGKISIGELLKELDQRNIRFSPKATRKELEALLSQETERAIKSDVGSSIHINSNANDKVLTSDNDDAITKQRQTMSLEELLQELDRRDIRYAATATKSELENLLLQTNKSITMPKANNNDDDDVELKEKEKEKLPQTIKKKQKPIQELIQELDDREIRYSPKATRKELESLLLNALDEDKTTMDQHDDNLEIDGGGDIDDAVENGSSNKGSLSSGKIPMPELLAELDKRGIRYRPTSSRKELESSLLRQDENRNGRRNDTQNKNSNSGGGSNSSSEKVVPSGAKQQQPLRIPLDELLQELDRRGIEYLPLASQKELESLLRKSIPVSELKKELNRRGIRYAPNASRTNLEKLLIAPPKRVQRQSGPDGGSSLPDEDEKMENSDNNPRGKRTSKATSMRRLLTELDRRGIDYSPYASQKDLEELLVEETVPSRNRRSARASSDSRQGRRQKSKDSSEKEDDTERQRNRQRRARRKNDPLETILKKTSSVAAQSVEEIPRRVSKLKDQTEIANRLKKAAERAKRITRSAVEYVLDDDGDDTYRRRRPSKKDEKETDFIREPDWYYVKKDDPIDVRAEPVDTEEKEPPRRPRRQRPRPRGYPSNPYERDETVWRDPTVWRERNRAQRQRRRRPEARSSSTAPPHRNRKPPTKPNSSRPLFQLPPSSNSTIPFPPASDRAAREDGSEAFISSEQEVSPPSSEKPRGRNRNMDNDKRIYSTYNVEEPDAFDKFGDLIANAAEEVLWGKEEDEEEDKNGSGNRKDGRTTRGASSERVREDMNDRKSTRSSKKNKRYWKDRLSEQVDHALGVHEDGRYYNSWQEKLDIDELRRDGNDAVSHFFARQTKGKRPKPDRQRHKDSTVPFWQEEGSIFSLLFGRTSSGEKLTMHKFIEEDVGTTALTTFFRSVLRTFFLLSSYTFRWASVRGALPQPFVVAGVAAAALSARPQRRVWTIALALVGMRTIGEMLHGYMYGDEGWDDDEEEYAEEDSRDESSYRQSREEG